MIETVYVYHSGEIYRVTFQVDTMEIFEVYHTKEHRGRVHDITTLPDDVRDIIEKRINE